MMVRITAVSVFCFLVAGVANAGSVQLGGTSGLTSNYISQGSGAVCAAGAGNCVAGSTSGFTEANFQTTLFSGANNTGVFTGYTQTGVVASGDTLGGSGRPTFAMIAGDNISDSKSATDSANFWGSTNTGTSSIVVPVGIFDVSDVWTMLQNEWGGLGAQDTSVTFNFGSTSNATSGLTSVTVNLNNENISSGTGEIRAAVDCSGVTTTTCSSSTNPRATPLETGVTIDGVTVNTISNLANSAYTTANGFYAGTTGTAKLDGQQFVFGTTYASDWLVSMTVTENNGLSCTGSGCLTGGPYSQTALTAITVDTAIASAPEPGTILLLVAGLGCIGALRLRRS